MPLKKGKSKRIIAANIRQLISEGYKPSQAAAISYRNAGKVKAKRNSQERYAKIGEKMEWYKMLN